jgi:hypothetical protein
MYYPDHNYHVGQSMTDLAAKISGSLAERIAALKSVCSDPKEIDALEEEAEALEHEASDLRQRLGFHHGGEGSVCGECNFVGERQKERDHPAPAMCGRHDGTLLDRGNECPGCVIRAEAWRAAMKASSEKMEQLAKARGHRGSKTVALFQEWCALADRKPE